MSRRVSRPAAVLLALVLSLSAPSAFATQYGRDFNPDFGTRIVRILKQLGRKLGIITSLDVEIIQPAPPRP
jgi:hypothetical protein